MRALIVEHGVNRGALAAARALASAGWTVDVIAGRASYTTASRDVRSWSCVRYPEGGTAEFVESVARVVRENGSDVVFPVDETQLLILSRYREQLKAVFPYPPHEVVERSTDRLEQAKIAQDAGLAVPPTMAARLSCWPPARRASSWIRSTRARRWRDSSPPAERVESALTLRRSSCIPGACPPFSPLSTPTGWADSALFCSQGGASLAH